MFELLWLSIWLLSQIAAAQDVLELEPVVCEGVYPHHLQGIATDGQAIYWSFTTTLVKTDRSGKLLAKVATANHHGDLCYHEGKLYVAVNLGEFNNPRGNADSRVYVYDAASLRELARHRVPEVIYGAGGIGVAQGHFFVVGGLPSDMPENYVYEYDADFRFIARRVIKSGHTHLGIQTATFAHHRWWFGCYGVPPVLLVTDADFRLLGRYPFDCALGIEGLPGGLSPGGRRAVRIGRVQRKLPDRGPGRSSRIAISPRKPPLILPCRVVCSAQHLLMMGHDSWQHRLGTSCKQADCAL